MQQEVTIHDKVFVPFITAAQIATRLKEIGSEIEKEYAGKKPLLIGVLNGSVIFMADLMRNISCSCEIGFIRVSSYEGMSTTGKVRNVLGLSESIKDRHVILVEDIIDTGDTAIFLLDALKVQEPASICFATMLFKPASLRQNVQPKFVGFEIPPDFVVGYGLDYDGLGRNLKDIYILKS
jgi:hypoxanthine phosphoribosyltransferase